MPEISVKLTMCDDDPVEYAITVDIDTDPHADLAEITHAVRGIDLSHILIAALACARPGEEFGFTVCGMRTWRKR